MSSTLNPTKVRVIITDHYYFKYGFRQPGCTNHLVADCPNDHKCMDYRNHTDAMDRAQAYAHTYHPRRRNRRGLQHGGRRPGSFTTNGPVTFNVDGMPIPAIDLTHDKETRTLQ